MKRANTLLLGSVLIILGTSCVTTKPKPQPTFLDRNSAILDKAQKKADDIGWVSMANLSISKPDDRFAFELTDGPNEYYRAARQERAGSAAVFDQAASAMGLAAAVQADPTQMGQLAVGVASAGQAMVANAQAHALRMAAAKTAYDAALSRAELVENEAERLELIAAAQREYAAAIPGQSTNVSLPTAPSDGSDVPAAPTSRATADIARSALANEKLAAMGALIGNANATVSPRSAIVTAAGDSAVEALLSAVFKPKADPSLGKIPMVGVATVSAEPGLRTANGFEAVIDNRVALEFEDVRYLDHSILDHFLKENLEIPTNVQRKLAIDAGLSQQKQDSNYPHFASIPVANVLNLQPAQAIPAAVRGGPVKDLTLMDIGVVSVLSPMTDVRSFNVADSYRRRREMALDLSFALRSLGLGGQASLFAQYARSLESDLATVFEENTVSAYAHGQYFGYIIRPQIVSSIGDKKKRVVTQKLLSQKPFPILVHFTLDRSDFKPYIGWDAENRWSVFVPRLKVISIPYWRPITGGSQIKVMSESERVALYKQLDELDHESEKSTARLVNHNVSPLELAESLSMSYKQKLGYSYVKQSLPTEYIIQQIPFTPRKKDETPPDPLKLNPSLIQVKIDRDGNTQPANIEIDVTGEDFTGYNRIKASGDSFLIQDVALAVPALPGRADKIKVAKIKLQLRPKIASAGDFILKTSFTIEAPSDTKKPPLKTTETTLIFAVVDQRIVQGVEIKGSADSGFEVRIQPGTDGATLDKSIELLKSALEHSSKGQHSDNVEIDVQVNATEKKP